MAGPITIKYNTNIILTMKRTNKFAQCYRSLKPLIFIGLLVFFCRTPLLAQEVIWHVKAIHPEGRTIDVKALDAEGNIYDVKAIRDTGQRQMMDVKAFVRGEKIPVKILVSNDKYAPVKAIGSDGTIYDIKALENDLKLDVKGVSRSGNIIHIKAINPKGEFYGIKALSPEGQLNDVKGIKMSAESIEGVINGVEVHAHIKAIPQVE
jgi:hypothetical protein